MWFVSKLRCWGLMGFHRSSLTRNRECLVWSNRNGFAQYFFFYPFLLTRDCLLVARKLAGTKRIWSWFSIGRLYSCIWRIKHFLKLEWSDWHWDYWESRCIYIWLIWPEWTVLTTPSFSIFYSLFLDCNEVSPIYMMVIHECHVLPSHLTKPG